MAVLDHIISGTFVSTGASKILNIQSGVDYINVVNYTQMLASAPTAGVKFEWFSTMQAGDGIEYKKVGSNVLQGLVLGLNGGGFTQIDTSQVVLGPVLVATAITAANPAVVSMASTAGLSVGDVVRITNAVGMEQISSMTFTITAITPSTSITLGYLDASGFAAAATSADVQKVFYDPIYYPRNRLITKITNANPCVVTLSVADTYTPPYVAGLTGITVGQDVVFNIPAAFGMVQLNGLRGVVSAVNAATITPGTNTISVNIDTTGFTAFAFPTSALAATGVTFPQVIPFGAAPLPPNFLANQNTLEGATRNTAIRGIMLGGGANGPAGQLGDVIHWEIHKSETIQNPS